MSTNGLSGGWIKLHRRLQNNALWQEKPFSRGQAWVDLLLLTNHQDGYFRVRGVKVELRRGQCGRSMLTLAGRWGWSRGKVSRFLDELETSQQIVQQNNRLTTIITIVNYDLYQGDDTTDDTSDSTTDGQQTDINKNEKKDKNKPLPEVESFFENLWNTYPDKGRIGKKEAKRHYLASVKTDADMDRINAALANYLNHLEEETWKRPQNGSTWFNNWQDWEPKGGE